MSNKLYVRQSILKKEIDRQKEDEKIHKKEIG